MIVFLFNEKKKNILDSLIHTFDVDKGTLPALLLYSNSRETPPLSEYMVSIAGYIAFGTKQVGKIWQSKMHLVPGAQQEV